MKRSIFAWVVAIAAIGICERTEAQELRFFQPSTVANSIKCEIGTFAKSVSRITLPANARRVRVAVTNTETDDSGLGATISSIVANLFKFGGQVSRSETRSGMTAIIYNLSSKQLPNCSKRDRVPAPGVGVLNCLSNNRHAFADAANGSQEFDEVSCYVAVTVKKGFSASLGIPIYVITFGPTFEGSTTGTFRIDIAVPPPKRA